LSVNISLYLFFYRKRGVTFMLRAIPWHWFYFLYGTLAFALGALRFAIDRFMVRARAGTKVIAPADKS
jgi:hypothetical protein